MENIKSLPPRDRPREKLRYQGAQALSDAELLAILLGKGTSGNPISKICDQLVKTELAKADVEKLCQIKGVGEAKALLLIAAVELGNRMHHAARMALKNDSGVYELLKPVFNKVSELQYILVLMTARKELLALVEGRSILPDISWVTSMAFEAGARRIIITRNGWLRFSQTETRYMQELTATAAALGLIVQGMMAVGEERFKVM